MLRSAAIRLRRYDFFPLARERQRRLVDHRSSLVADTGAEGSTLAVWHLVTGHVGQRRLSHLSCRLDVEKILTLVILDEHVVVVGIDEVARYWVVRRCPPAQNLVL